MPTDDNPLTKVQSVLLYLMWRRRRSGDGRLSTAKDLLGDLTTAEFAVEFAAVDDKKLRKPLRHLAEAGLVESGSAPKVKDSDPGPSPTGYRLPDEAKTIGWQSTARLVLELFNHREKPVDARRFIQEMMQLGLCQDDTGNLSSKEDIERQIEYCVRKGYLIVHKVAHSHAGLIDTGALECTELVDQHLGFLQRIAVPKRPAASESGSPPIVSDANAPGGGGSPR
jgi:hypothetical protein